MEGRHAPEGGEERRHRHRPRDEGERRAVRLGRPTQRRKRRAPVPRGALLAFCNRFRSCASACLDRGPIPLVKARHASGNGSGKTSASEGNMTARKKALRFAGGAIATAAVAV